MKRLTHCDIKQDRWYKVVRVPSYLESIHHNYDVIGKIGKCRWVQPVHGANMLFDGCKERLVPPECLAPAEDPTVKKDMNIPLTEKDIIIGHVYFVWKEPHFYERAGYKCPVLGKFGKLISRRGDSCILLFGRDEIQHLVPIDCLQDMVKPAEPAKKKEEIPDGLLVKRMIQNPAGVLKLIKGLAKMNKDCALLAFLERGTII